MYDVDLDSMTLILNLDLDMVKMWQHTKNEVSMLTGSKVITQTDTHTHTHTHYENVTSTACAGSNEAVGISDNLESTIET